MNIKRTAAAGLVALALCGVASPAFAATQSPNESPRTLPVTAVHQPGEPSVEHTSHSVHTASPWDGLTTLTIVNNTSSLMVLHPANQPNNITFENLPSTTDTYVSPGQSYTINLDVQGLVITRPLMSNHFELLPDSAQIQVHTCNGDSTINFGLGSETSVVASDSSTGQSATGSVGNNSFDVYTYGVLSAMGALTYSS